MSAADAKRLLAQGLDPKGASGSPLLGFASRIKSATGAPITRGDGITARATSAMSQAQLEAIGGNRTYRAKLNKILTNLGDTYIARIRKLVAGLGTYKTGQFYSGFRQERWDDHGQGFNTAVSIVNPVPYSGYVHPKGTAKSATVLKIIRREIAPKMRAELKADLRTAFKDIAKARILSGSRA